jgi:hypothetical protein
LIAPAKVFDLSSLTQGDPELSMDLSTKVWARKGRSI